MRVFLAGAAGAVGTRLVPLLVGAGFIHVLLVIALVVILLRLIGGRNPI